MGTMKNKAQKLHTRNAHKNIIIRKTKTETFAVSIYTGFRKGLTKQIKKMNQQKRLSLRERDINKYTSPNTVTKYYLDTK